MPFATPHILIGGGRGPPSLVPYRSHVLVGTLSLALGLALYPVLFQRARRRQSSAAAITPSPRRTVLPELSDEEVQGLPYPPDVLPGGRQVVTPYGSVQVYEWGPEAGEKVLLLHGISTPSILLGDLGRELVGKGYRVMLFDFFGRGYSDTPPADCVHDKGLYITQMLLVTASSRLAWSQFHVVGYSFGGGVGVAFARYFPQRLLSLTSLAGGGLVRAYHVSWKSQLLYNYGVLPEWLVRALVQRRIRPSVAAAAMSEEKQPGSAGGSDLLAAESTRVMTPRNPIGDGDANGGRTFASAPVSRLRPGVTVSSIVAWQIDRHQGFLTAFLSSIRHGPIYAPQEDWAPLADLLSARREAAATRLGGRGEDGLRKGKVLFILGKEDSVVVASETMEDAQAALGVDGAQFAVLEGGHEIAFACSAEVANVLDRFWTS